VEFVHAEKASVTKKSADLPRARGICTDGSPRRGGRRDQVSESDRSLPPGFHRRDWNQKPTWRPLRPGRRAVNASKPRVPHGPLAGTMTCHGRFGATTHPPLLVFIEGADHGGKPFLLTSRRFLVPTCGTATSSSWTISAHTRPAPWAGPIRAAGARVFYLPEILARSEPNRAVLRQVKTLAAQKPHSEPPSCLRCYSRRSCRDSFTAECRQLLRQRRI